MKSISDLGEPIETVEFQALRVELGNHLYRLMAQMVTLYNERDQKKEIAFFVNDLYLVSAPQVNAAVILGGKSQITKGVLQTRIVLTTGLFRFLRETLTRDGVLNRDGVMKALIGILAHEIAHVFELESTDSLLKRYRRTGSQANEALADQDAIMILREAGYPPECLYVAMQLIVQYQEEERKKEGETDGEKPSTWKVATDTHPQDELRLSLQRLGLTFGRVLFGGVPPDLKMPDKAFWNEFHDIAERVQVVKRDSPVDGLEQNLDLNKIREQLSEKKDRERNSLQYSHLINTLAEQLTARNDSPPDSEFLKWWAGYLVENTYRSQGYYNYVQFPEERSSSWRIFLTPDQRKLEKLHPVNAIELLENSSWMNSEIFREHFREAFFKRFGNDLLQVEIHSRDPTNKSKYLLNEGYIRGTEMISKRQWFWLFEKEWMWIFRQSLDQPTKDMEDRLRLKISSVRDEKFKSRFGVPLSMLKMFPLRERIKLLQIFLEKVSIDSHMAIELFLDQVDAVGEPAAPFLLVARYKDEDEKELSAYLDQHPDAAALLKPFHERFLGEIAFAQLIVNDGYFGGHLSVNWPIIYKLLGLGEEEGGARVREALTEFLKSLDAYDFLSQAFEKRNLRNEPKIDIRWMTPKFFDQLMDGGGIPRLVLDTELQQKWRARLRDIVMHSHAQFYEPHFRQLAKREIESQPEKFDFKDFVQRQYPESPGLFDAWSDHRFMREEHLTESPLFKWTVDEIIASNVPKDLKSKWLKSIYLEQSPDWIDMTNANETLSTLLQNKVLSGPSEALPAMKKHLTTSRYGGDKPRLDFGVYSRLEPLLQQELEKIKTSKAFSAYARRVFMIGKEYSHPDNAAYVRLMNRALERMDSFSDLDLAEKLKLYSLITGAGSSLETDAYFSTTFLPRLEELQLTRKALELLILNARTQKLRLELVKRYFAKNGFDEYDRLQTPRGIRAFLSRLENYLPSRSMEKDDYLEELIWELGVDDLALLTEMENGKSLGRIRQATPFAVNVASALANWVDTLSSQEKQDFILYLSAPGPLDIPASLAAKIEEYATKESEHYKPSEQTVDNNRFELKMSLVSARQRSWPQKIPLIEFLLTQGKAPLARQESYRNEILYQQLNLKRDSSQAAALRAYLKSVPEYEEAVSLAYLLARRSEGFELGSGGLKDIFELFQIVGKKAGQAVNTWKLMEGSGELRDLKDRAKPLTKFEIVTAVHETLPADQAIRIKRFKRILAAGSIKTYTDVELDNGSEAALAIQSKYAARQVHSTIGLARTFLHEMQDEGLVENSLFLDSLAQSIERQLIAELDLKAEAERARTAAQVFSRVSSQIDLGDWKVSVPQPLADFTPQTRLVLYNKVNGEAIDRLLPEVQHELRPKILELYLNAFFKEAWIDADRSLANQLLDVPSKTVFILDFGQTEQFSVSAKPWDRFKSDERVRLLELLQAGYRRDSRALADAVGAMLVAESRTRWNPTTSQPVIDEIAEMFSHNGHFSGILISLAKNLENHGFHLEPAFSVYALKGILTLYGENYVTPEEFPQALTTAATNLVKEKRPYFVMREITSVCSRLLRR